MRTQLALWAGALAGTASRFTHKGAGITWQGQIGLQIHPHLSSELSAKLKHIVLIAGTNGKTTTAAMAAHILRTHAFHVLHNSTGANLHNGITGTLMSQYKLISRYATIGIFEVDEATLPHMIKMLQPDIVILLNLFRDQLDRYGEVDTIASRWKEALFYLPRTATLIVNADDPLIVSISQHFQGTCVYFGLPDNMKSRSYLSHASDSIYCPMCGSKLHYSHIFLAHLGIWKCPDCQFKHPKPVKFSVYNPVKGTYNLYNVYASMAASSVLGIEYESAQKSLHSFVPAFGRQEQFSVKNTRVQLFLSKNPAGCNENIATIREQDDIGAILIALNDRIPDGTDISWIWDVDFEMLSSLNVPIYCTGDRAWDLGIRMHYAIGMQKNKITTNYINVYENYRHALKTGLATIPFNKTLYILPTYSALLEIRKELVGRNIL